MPETTDENKKSFDPFESFRGMRDAYLDAMSKTMVETVNTESYAQASGAVLDYCLSASAPFREALDKSMAQTLQQLSLPTRQEFATLAERFTNVEMRLDDLDAKLDQVLAAMTTVKNGRNGKPEPARAKKQRKRS
jgi:Poly(R)-hydroxyalkanoic acid synthase subunit (PHA_synth_III_E)